MYPSGSVLAGQPRRCFIEEAPADLTPEQGRDWLLAGCAAMGVVVEPQEGSSFIPSDDLCNMAGLEEIPESYEYESPFADIW